MSISPHEKLGRIAHSSVPDSERVTGLARLSTCIADAGIIAALQQVIASPALFELTDAEIAYKLQNIKRAMSIPDDAIQTLNTPGNRIGEINARRMRNVPALTHRGIVTDGPPALYRPTERAFTSGPDATIVAQSGDRL
ncbi:hypothetical protein BA011_33740 (plasmid) [Rhizobium leguminosarum]|uniref:Uncharacterized protein n=1 Tax=Rhizobium leguminosarum TaxID=384 RepID=A0A1B1CMA3_RHILE|nr:hypothetical protein BA011_33740 [Rhizobium leguminosarum]